MSNQGTGYKKPPPHARFKPGQSGNPAGRPKRAPSFSAALLAELAETIPGSDKKHARTKLQAFVRKVVDAAIAGDARAQAVLVGALARIGDVEANEPDAIAPDDREILEAYVGGRLERRSHETDAAPSPGEENTH